MFSLKNQVRNLLIAIFILSALLLVRQSLAQSAPNNSMSDAIAVRIIPNPNHYSISRWYESQGFQGSPQSLTVDGYEAIRDGRTVYVNAANVTSTSIFTNIYLISYNQEPAVKTVDILGQLVSHWKFNSNLLENSNPAPSCAISSLSCASDADCPNTAQCASSGLASSSCVLKVQKYCVVDTDCPANFFCDSLKSKISRDMQRLGRIGELQEAIAKFKEKNSRYPLLSSGTYLVNYSLSSWPSWSQVLLTDLVSAQSLIDPINRLGACPGYDLKTCWNKDTNRFVSAPLNNSLQLPAGSYAFAYAVSSSGSNYNLCSTLETKDTSYHFNPNDPLLNSACMLATGVVNGGHASNTPPQVNSKSLSSLARQEFTGYVEVIDPDNDPLTWRLTTTGTNWTGWKNGGQMNQAPILKDTGNPNQKKIYAQLAGEPGTYNVNLEVNDGRDNGILNITLPLKIVSSLPFIEAENGEYVLDPTIPVNYNFLFSSANLNNPASAYNVTLVSGPPGSFNLLNNLTKTFSPLGADRYKVAYAGLVPTSQKFYQDTDFVYQVIATDKYNNSAIKNFKIKVVVNNPLLNVNCETLARQDQSYSCTLGPLTQGNYALGYSVNGLPAGLSLVSNIISGIPTATSSSLINIKTANNYGASSTQSFILQVNNYCGDGIKQSPNLEGRGGLYNDGREDCDGLEGITNMVDNSSINLQYGCQTGVGSTTPNPILTNNYCVFKSPLAGGGYCGDGYCQKLVNGTSRENCWSCPVDCGVCVTSDVLTNVDFEATGVNGFPTNWDGGGQRHSSTGVSTAFHRSGEKSAWLHQDPGYYYPGTCNKSTCEDLNSAYSSPSYKFCEFKKKNHSSQCEFAEVDYSHPTAPAVYAQGATLVWPNTNRVMWANLVYKMDKLPFQKDDIYQVSFYYRGTTTNNISVALAPSLGWEQQCASFNEPGALKPGCSASGPSFTCQNPNITNPCAEWAGDLCQDQPGHCCLQAPYQKKCFTGMEHMPPIESGRYVAWQKYSSGFVYSDEMISWVAKISSTTPYAACPTGGCRPQIEIGVNMNYGSTTNNGFSGSDFYIDDFSVKKVIVE